MIDDCFHPIVRKMHTLPTAVSSFSSSLIQQMNNRKYAKRVCKLIIQYIGPLINNYKPKRKNYNHIPSISRTISWPFQHNIFLNDCIWCAMRTCTYIYICTHVCTNISIYIYRYIFMYTCMHEHISMFLYLHVCMCVRLQAVWKMHFKPNDFFSQACKIYDKKCIFAYSLYNINAYICEIERQNYVSVEMTNT